MRGRRAQQAPLAGFSHTNGKQQRQQQSQDALYPPLPDGADFTSTLPPHLSSAFSSAASSFLPASASPLPPVSPTSFLPPLSDELPLLEDAGAGSPPVCPDCAQPLTVQAEDGALLLHCPNCLHSRHMTTEPLFPPTASISSLGALLSRPAAVDDTADSSSGQLSRTVSQLFGSNGRANSFIPMGDSLAPPSAAPSFASTLSFTASTSVPLASTSSIATLSSAPYSSLSVYDDNGGFASPLDSVSNPINRTMSNAYSAFSTTATSFTSWSATPHPSYLSDREGAALRHVASVSSRPVLTLYQFDIDSITRRPVGRPYAGSSGGGHGNSGYDGDLVLEVPRERLSIDRHSLTVVPLAATTLFHRLPVAPVAALHLPVPATVTATATATPSTRRLHASTASTARRPASASPGASGAAGAGSSSQDLGPAHYIMISELHIDELCSQLAVRRCKVPAICRAALQHVMRQIECTYSSMQHVWKAQASDAANSTAITKAKTSHAVSLASAVFYYVYQQHVQQQDKQAAPIPLNTSLPSSAPIASSTSRSPPRASFKWPQLHMPRLVDLIAASADKSNQYPISLQQLSTYIVTITPLLAPLDLDAMSGPPSAATILLSRPLHVEACRPSFIEYADKFKQLLDADTLVLAVDILNAAVRLNLSSRRNHTSLSAAALFLACCLQSVRLTQHDFCQRIGLTEVTLRKVNKELGTYWRQLVPPEYAPKVVPHFLVKQEANEQKKSEQSRLKAEATVVDDGESETSRPVSPKVKKEPVDEPAAGQPAAATGSLRLVYHEPFDTLGAFVALPLPLATDATAVPPRVLTRRHRFSPADALSRVGRAMSRTRSSLPAAVTSDSDTEEEEGDAGERSMKEERSSRRSAVAVTTPAFLPPHVPLFYNVRS